MQANQIAQTILAQLGGNKLRGLCLIILLAFANLAKADDVLLKALLVGAWKGECSSKITVYQSDGKEIYDDGYTAGWDIKNGDLIETEGEKSYYFNILLLTKHELLIQEPTHGKSYLFFTR